MFCCLSLSGMYPLCKDKKVLSSMLTFSTHRLLELFTDTTVSLYCSARQCLWRSAVALCSAQQFLSVALTSCSVALSNCSVTLSSCSAMQLFLVAVCLLGSGNVQALLQGGRHQFFELIQATFQTESQQIFVVDGNGLHQLY